MSKTTHKNRIKQSLGENIFDVCNIIFMILFSACMIIPMWHVICVSLTQGEMSLKGGLFLWPKGTINFKGYQTVFEDSLLLRSFLNTILYAVCGVFCTCFFTSLTAYPLSIPGFKLKGFITVFLTITMFISGGLVPTYMLMKKLKLVNTIFVMFIPFCVGAYNTVLFRTFFQGLSPELREAARIDGAGEMSIYFKLYFPLSKPIFATIGLFSFVGHWNGWFSALIYLNDEKMYPVQMILRKIIANTSALQAEADIQIDVASELTTENIKMAAIVVTVFPILCIYPFLQKYFVKGVFVGSIKG